MTRYGRHEPSDIPAPQDTTHMNHAPSDHTTPKQENVISDDYGEELNTCHP